MINITSINTSNTCNCIITILEKLYAQKNVTIITRTAFNKECINFEVTTHMYDLMILYIA